MARARDQAKSLPEEIDPQRAYSLDNLRRRGVPHHVIVDGIRQGIITPSGRGRRRFVMGADVIAWLFADQKAANDD